MLRILVDKTIEDKNRDSYVKALKRECERQGKHCKIIYVDNEYDSIRYTTVQLPIVVTEPFSFRVREGYMDADNHATARVILDITKNYKPRNVLVINRSELIGRALVNGLLDQNHTPIIAHSKTNPYSLIDYADKCDIFITATGTDMNDLDFRCAEAVIDVSGDVEESYFDEYTTYYGMSEIGRLTVKKIVNEIK